MTADDCRGIWPSEHAYIAAQIAEHLPAFLAWLPACCDPVKLRDGYTGTAIQVGSTPVEGGVMVFETALEDPRPPR